MSFLSKIRFAAIILFLLGGSKVTFCMDDLSNQLGSLQLQNEIAQIQVQILDLPFAFVQAGNFCKAPTQEELEKATTIKHGAIDYLGRHFKEDFSQLWQEAGNNPKNIKIAVTNNGYFYLVTITQDIPGKVNKKIVVTFNEETGKMGLHSNDFHSTY